MKIWLPGRYPYACFFYRSLRPLFLSLLPGSQKELEKLRRKRESLANELSELISEGITSRLHTKLFLPLLSLQTSLVPSYGLIFTR